MAVGLTKMPPIPQPKIYAAPKVTPLGKSITKQEDGYLVRTSWQVSTGEEARVYGYAYLGSRMETPFPTPLEFLKIVQERNLDNPEDVRFGVSVNELYNDLQRYFKVQARTWHQAWSLLEDGPYVAEVDTLFAGSQVVHAQVLIPGWAVFNPVYRDQPDSRLKDEDYFVLSCALSVKGTRDVQDIRAEAVQTVTVRELKEA